MSYTITRESFDSLASYWSSSTNQLKWDSVFVLPAWLEAWWRVFQPATELYLCAIRQESDIIGIAPLQIKETEASFIGSPDVCDYMDFVTAPGKERDFFSILLDDLKQQSITRLDLAHLRADSTAYTALLNIAGERNYETICHEVASSLEMDLPPTFDEYLENLSAKQRHEVRRKLRRLSESGKIDYRYITVNEGIADLLNTFLKLFALSWEDKASFMTPRMESFFRAIADAMAALGLLWFGTLEVDTVTAAMTMGFDYNDTVYLYNSAYDPEYSYLSVGILSKVLGIKESLQMGRKKWDFLKGDEPYKYNLGGSAVPLHSCQIAIK